MSESNQNNDNTNDKKTFKKLMKYVLLFVALVIVIILAIGGYLYYKGGESNYVPPETEELSSNKQIISDLETISSALESFYTQNLAYPASLDELSPDFIEKIPYADEQGLLKYEPQEDSYTITVTKPEKFDYQQIKVENGEIKTN